MRNRFGIKVLYILLALILAAGSLAVIPQRANADKCFMPYEAESNSNIIEGVVCESSGSSGGRIVRVNGSGKILQFNNIYVDATRVYTVEINYISAEARYGYISVNGGTGARIDFSSTGSWSTVGTKLVDVNLNAGYNTIRFYNDSVYMPDFDNIRVENGAPDMASYIEAEASGNICGGGVWSNPQCSGGKFVGYVGSGNILQFNNVYVCNAGNYIMAVYYVSAENRAGYYSVNDANERYAEFPGTGSWTRSGIRYLPVYLHAGYNYIKFYNSSAYMPDFDRISILDEAVLAVNGGFENGSGSSPESWITGFNGAAKPELKWEAKTGFNDSKCIRITSNSPNDAYWLQKVQLEPWKCYTLSGYIRGENIASSGNNTGANICVYSGSTWYKSESKGSNGTFKWKKVTLSFQAPADGKVVIGCRLGFSNSAATGSAWFDNITVESDSSMEIHEGTHVSLALESSDIAAFRGGNYDRWIGKLDKAYDTMLDFTGYKPFNGEKIHITSTHQSIPGWAIAGNPIYWYQPNVKPQLISCNDIDDWSWGILHEIGHDFDNDKWKFDNEFLASLKAYYTIVQNNGTCVLEGKTYHGSELDEYFKGRDTLIRGSYSNDALLYRMILISRKVGWEPFKNTFRYFQYTSSGLPTTKAGKFNLFLDKLNDYANDPGYRCNVKSVFTLTELKIIQNALK